MYIVKRPIRRECDYMADLAWAILRPEMVIHESTGIKVFTWLDGRALYNGRNEDKGDREMLAGVVLETQRKRMKYRMTP